MGCQQPFHFLCKPGETNQELSFQLFLLLIICPKRVLALLNCFSENRDYESVGGFGSVNGAEGKPCCSLYH